MQASALALCEAKPCGQRRRSYSSKSTLHRNADLPSARTFRRTKGHNRATLRLRRALTLDAAELQPISNDSAGHGLILSPGGFLVSYYLGVLECLSHLKLLDAQTPISGTSAGALAAAFVVSDLSVEESLDITREIQAHLLRTGYGWKVIDILKDALLNCMPDDVHLRASNRIGIGVTVYSPKSKTKKITGKVLTRFDSHEEFVDAVVASCYIPYFLGPRLGIEWSNGSIYSDGMPTNFFPEVPTESQMFRPDTITVSAMPRANRRMFDDRGVDISPDRRPASEIPSVWKTLWNGLVPLREEEVDSYKHKGYSDTLLWAQQCDLQQGTASTAVDRTNENSLSVDM